MGSFSFVHWMVVLVVVFLIFGSRLPNAMGDLAKGIKAFKNGMKDDAVEENAAAKAEKVEAAKLEPGKIEH